MVRKYRVTSRAPTLSHEQGEVFSADISRDLEAQLIARGAIERVKRGDDEKKERIQQKVDDDKEILDRLKD